MKVCPYCKREYKDTPRFCPNCGKKLPTRQRDASARDPRPEKPRRKWPWVLAIVLGSTAILATAGFFAAPVVIEQVQIAQYNAGADALAAKDYNAAAKAFSTAGDYADAAELAAYAQQGAALDNAKNLAAHGYETAAMQILETIPTFPGAQEYLQQLADANDPEAAAQRTQYETAKQYFEQGAYDYALTLFDALTGYADADDYVEQCRWELATARAEALMDAEDYGTALTLLESEEIGPYVRGREDMIAECKWLLSTVALRQLVASDDLAAAYDYLNSEYGQYVRDPDLIRLVSEKGKYRKAQLLFDAEQYYSAYVLFNELGDYNDAAARAARCVQPRPRTGEIYRNEH